MSDLLIILFILFVLLAFVWVTFGYINYRKFMASMNVYETSYIKHEQLEKSAPTVELKTKHFNEKENLINKYPRMHEVLLTKEEQGDKFYRTILLSFLKYGFLYNMT